MMPAVLSGLGWDDNQTHDPHGWKNDVSRTLILSMMGYLHGVNEADCHHSMTEVISGACHADELIGKCFEELGAKRKTKMFGYLNYEAENLMTEVIQTAKCGAE